MSKKLVSLLVLFFLLLSYGSVVSAEIIPHSQYLINVYFSTAAPSGSGNLIVSGRTTTYSIVDEVSVTVYLQQWNGSTWVNIGSPIVGRIYNNNVIGVSAERVVQKNRYYRTWSIHEAKIGATTERLETNSNIIYHQ